MADLEYMRALPPIEEMPEAPELEAETPLADFPAAAAPPEGETPLGDMGDADEDAPEAEAPAPAAEAEDAPEAEAEAEAAPDVTREQAEAFAALEREFARDPAALIRNLIENASLTPEQKAALGLAEAEAAEDDDPDWLDEDLTAPELLVKQHRADIERLPAFQQEVQESVSILDGNLRYLAYQTAKLEAFVKAAHQSLGLTLPEADSFESVHALVASGKHPSYEAAFAAQYQPKVEAAVQKAQAAKRPTPKTPIDAGSGVVADYGAKEGDDLLTIFRKVQAAGR